VPAVFMAATDLPVVSLNNGLEVPRPWNQVLWTSPLFAPASMEAMIISAPGDELLDLDGNGWPHLSWLELFECAPGRTYGVENRLSSIQHVFSNWNDQLSNFFLIHSARCWGT